MDIKPVWQSKTLWISLILAIAAFSPSVQTLIQAHTEGFGLITGGVFGFLRMITKGKVSIS